MRKIIQKKHKAFSLLETLITLAIFGILMAMLTQVILINLQVSRKTFARSRVREEISELITLIQRDVRNADLIKDCGQSTVSGIVVNSCAISHVEEFVWTDKCPNETSTLNRVCKLDLSGNPIFITSDFLNFSKFSFETGTSSTKTGAQQIILVTLVANTVNPSFEVNNQVRQVAVSSRNYTLGASGSFSSTSPATPTPSPTPTGPVCPYTSTQVRARLNSTSSWSSSLNFTCGQSIQLASFHNNNLASFATDTIFGYSGPANGSFGPGATVRTIVLNIPGTYSLNVRTNGYLPTDPKCTGSATVSCTTPTPTAIPSSSGTITMPNGTVCVGTGVNPGMCGPGSRNGNMYVSALNESCTKTCQDQGKRCNWNAFSTSQLTCDFVASFIRNTSGSTYSCSAGTNSSTPFLWNNNPTANPNRYFIYYEAPPFANQYDCNFSSAPPYYFYKICPCL